MCANAPKLSRAGDYGAVVNFTMGSVTASLCLVVALTGCSGGDDSATDDGRGGNSDITANPSGSSDDGAAGSGGSEGDSGDSGESGESDAVEALPFNAGGLLGGNANPVLPDGVAGEVSVVATGPFITDDFGSASLPVAFRNNTSEAVSHVDLSATARAGGELVATGASQGADPSQVQPGEVGLAFIYFDSVGDVDPKSLSYDFAVETSPADTSAFNTAPFTVAEANNNGSAIIGTATNDTGAAASGPFSVSVYCFAGNKLLDRTGSYADQDGSIEPGGTVSFTVDLYDTKCAEFAVGVSGYFD